MDVWRRMAGTDTVTRGRRIGVRGIALLSAMGALLATAPVVRPAHAAGTEAGMATHHKKSKVNDAWSSRTETVADPAAAEAGNPQCQALKRNVMAKVASIRALRDQIEKEKSAPPKTVVGTLQKMMGESYTSDAAAKSSRKIVEARKSADELNSLLDAANCSRVDIDDEVSKSSAADQALQAPGAVTPQSLDKRERTIFDEPAKQ